MSKIDGHTSLNFNNFSRFFRKQHLNGFNDVSYDDQVSGYIQTASFQWNSTSVGLSLCRREGTKTLAARNRARKLKIRLIQRDKLYLLQLTSTDASPYALATLSVETAFKGDISDTDCFSDEDAYTCDVDARKIRKKIFSMKRKWQISRGLRVPRVLKSSALSRSPSTWAVETIAAKYRRSSSRLMLPTKLYSQVKF